MAVQPIQILLIRAPGVHDPTVDAALAADGAPSPRFRATSVETALKALSARRYALILLDVSVLGEEGGDRGCARLRAAAPDTPILVLARGADDGALVAALRRGADDYVRTDHAAVELIERAVRDALERRGAREALRELEARYRILFQDCRDAVYITSRDGGILEMNDAALELFSPEQIAGGAASLYVREEERARFQEAVERTGSVRDFPVELRKKDGSVMRCLLTSTLRRGADGGVLGYQGIIRDVTERDRTEEALRESEARYRMVLEQASDGIFLTDPAGRFRAANRRGAEMLGLGRDEVSGRTLGDVVAPESLEQAPLDLPSIGVEAVVVERPLVRKDGTRFPAEIGATRLATGELQFIVRDVTERKRAETALRRSEQYFRSLIENASDLVSILDEDGTVQYSSPAMERMLGWDPASRKGRPAFDVVHPEDLPRVGEAFRTILASPGAAVTVELRARGADGAYRILEVTSTNLLHDPVVHGIVLNSRDVSERREAEKRLRESEERFAALFMSSRDAIFFSDEEGRVLEANDAAYELLGYSRADAAPVRTPDLYVDPEARQLFQAAIAGPGFVRDMEVELRRKDGETVHCLLTATAVRRDGRLAGYQGILHDITERKRMEAALRQSEEYFRSLIDNTSDMITVSDAEGRLRYVGPAIERVLEVPASAWIGANFREFVHPDDREHAAASFRRVMEEPGRKLTVVARYRHGDGGWRTMEVVRHNLLHVPSVAGVVSHGRDISERLEAEAALRSSEEQLRQAQKMEAVGQLAGGVAHDFNNLLTAIQGHADLVRETLPEDSPVQPDLQEVVKAAERAASLTRQLLAFSRRQVLQPRVLDPHHVVAEMERMLGRLIGEQIRLVTEGVDAGRVRADRSQLEQVLLNLAVNARDAMPTGGVLRIRTEAVEVDAAEAARLAPPIAPGPYVRLQVSDTGSGMSEEVQRRAFEPFFTTKEQGKGTGLGLSTVYGIVKQSDGVIDVDSVPGRGSTFTIWLPRVEEAAAPTDASGPATRPRGGETVLVAEDEPAVRALVRKLMERDGYQVLVADDGVTALRIADGHEGPIHLLLTDIIMPHVGGRELAQRLRPHRPEMRVLYMSGYTDEASRQDPIEAEAGFLQKPFTPEGLTLAVRAALGRPAAPDAVRAPPG